jgi:predicted CopG family antitoxin
MTKVILLSDEAYKELKRIRRKGESFSDVVLRLIHKTTYKPLSEFAGKWVGNDIDVVFQQVLHEREKASSREAHI